MSAEHAETHVAYPPETAEGWYALHQIFRIDLAQAARLAPALARASSTVFAPRPAGGNGAGGNSAGGNGADGTSGGWSEAVQLIGSTADVMFVHFRPTLDEIGVAQRALANEPWMGALVPVYSFLSVAEAGLYRLSADLVRDAAGRGGSVGDADYQAKLVERRAADIANPYVQKRLYPVRPATMPYVCFYPMSKRRAVGQNWYALPVEERNRLMQEHGLTGRRYAGKVTQVISGAIGFDAWEWGVTLFAGDPLEFKKIVSEMRFDEVSAQYAEFGPFYVGRVGDLPSVLGPGTSAGAGQVGQG